MRLTAHTDYAFRILMFLTVNNERGTVKLMV